MSVIKNIAAFKNWPLYYAARYGLLRHEFEMVHRNGIKLKLRPHTDDLKIVKSNWVTRHYIRDFIPITKDSVVVDVGAHIGAFSVMAAKMASGVLSFEPEPSNFQMLKRNVELNSVKNISIFEMAVTGGSGDQSLLVYEDGSTGTHSLYGSGEGLTGMREIQVKAISIEEIIEKEGLSRIDFLKLDCEGAEHDILRNMSSDSAAKIMYMAMETHAVQRGVLIDLPCQTSGTGFRGKGRGQWGLCVCEANP